MWHDHTATHYQYRYTYVRVWCDMTRQQPITNTALHMWGIDVTWPDCNQLPIPSIHMVGIDVTWTDSNPLPYMRDWCDMTRQQHINNTTIHMWGIDVTWSDSNTLPIPLYICEVLMWHDQTATNYQYRYTYVRDWCDMTRQQLITNTTIHMWGIDVTWSDINPLPIPLYICEGLM